MIFNKVKTLSDKMIDTNIIHGFLGGVNGILKGEEMFFSTDSCCMRRGEMRIFQPMVGCVFPNKKSAVSCDTADRSREKYWFDETSML